MSVEWDEMHFDVRLLQRVPCAFLPLARIARLRPSRFRLTVPNPARRRGRVADACVLLALIRNGANAPAFSDAPPFALQRRACAAGIVSASCGALPRLAERFGHPPAVARLAHRRLRPSRSQPWHWHDDRVGLLLDRRRPRALQGPAPVDPLCACVSTPATHCRPLAHASPDVSLLSCTDCVQEVHCLRPRRRAALPPALTPRSARRPATSTCSTAT